MACEGEWDPQARYLCLLKSVLHFLSSSRVILCCIHLATKLLEQRRVSRKRCLSCGCFVPCAGGNGMFRKPMFCGMHVSLGVLASRWLMDAPVPAVASVEEAVDYFRQLEDGGRNPPPPLLEDPVLQGAPRRTAQHRVSLRLSVP